MKLQPIALTSVYYNQKPVSVPEKKETSFTGIFDNLPLKFPKPVTELQKMKVQADEYPEDVEYRKNLLVNSGRHPMAYARLRPIIGAQELMTIMEAYDNDESKYSVGGEELDNLMNKTFRANIHIHTIASDGYYTPQKLLDETASYANAVAREFHKDKDVLNAPFLIAITDHDTLESAAEVINIIYDNPVKYKNLRVVLGSEMTALLDTDHKKIFHLLNYNIDPNEAKYKAFIDGIKEKKAVLTTNMIGFANATYELITKDSTKLFSEEEAKYLFKPLALNTNGMYNYLKSYIGIKYYVHTQVAPKLGLESDEVMKDISNYLRARRMENKFRHPAELLSKYMAEAHGVEDFRLENSITADKMFAYLESYKIGNCATARYLPNISEVCEALENQPDAILGIAHPLDYVKTRPLDSQKKDFLREMYRVFSDVAGDRAVFSEAYYQSYKPSLNAVKEQPDFIEFFDEISEEYGLYKTGSLDTHRENFYKRY